MVVSDTTPITTLLKVSQVDLLRQLFGSVSIKRKKLITSMRAMIEVLETKGGLYLSTDLKAEVLKVAGE